MLELPEEMRSGTTYAVMKTNALYPDDTEYMMPTEFFDELILFTRSAEEAIEKANIKSGQLRWHDDGWIDVDVYIDGVLTSKLEFE